MPLSRSRLFEILVAERNKAAQKIAILQEKLEALQTVIDNFDSIHPATSSQHPKAQLNPLRATRIPLTRIIVSILEHHRDGLTLEGIVKSASAQGMPIKATSTATMLNRLKASGVVEHFGRMYRIRRGD